jgi:DnaJ-class molecular chaperone
MEALMDRDTRKTSATQGRPKLNPGDQAAPGTPGAGENVCPDCRGSGKLDAAPCKTCGGTGVVIEGMGGG